MPRPDGKASTTPRPLRSALPSSSVAGQSHTIERFVMARLLELADQRSRWNRALWQASSVVAIAECLEYDTAVRVDGVSGEGLTYVTAYTAEQVTNDPGCGDAAARQRVADLLLVASSGKTSGKPLSEADHDALSQLAVRISGGYLAAWHAEIQAGFPSAGISSSAAGPAELVARSIASHMFDVGFSGHHLHGWFLAAQQRISDGASPRAELLALVAEADTASHRASQQWRVLVPVRQPSPRVVVDGEDPLLSAEMMQQLCATKGLRPPRQGTRGVWVAVTARDAHAALAEVDAVIRRLAARARVGGRGALTPTGKAWIEGETDWRDLTTWAPVAHLPSVQRHDLLFAPLNTPDVAATTQAQLDDALELFAALDASTSGASVASAWAAIESLLGGRAPRPGVGAADRLAAIITCSYSRAELSVLAHTWKSHGDDSVATQLAAAGSTTRRLDIVEAALRSTVVPTRVEVADPVGAARAVALVRNPAAVLARVRRYVEASVRRLYDQRNRIMHAARFNSVALPVALRTTPTLVAAGLDRIVNAAHASPPITPMKLAARADNELQLLATPAARPPHRLLD